MANKKISIDALSETVMKELNEYADLACADMKEAVKSSSTLVKGRSPGQGHSRCHSPTGARCSLLPCILWKRRNAAFAFGTGEPLQHLHLEASGMGICGGIRRRGIIETCAQVLATLNDTAPLEQKVERLQAEQDMVYGRIESLIHENAQVAQGQEAYNRRMKALYTRCEELKSSMVKVRSQIMDRAGRSRNVEACLQRISRTDLLTEFDESVFTGTVDCLTVRKGQGKNDRQMVFRFKDGTEIPMTI